MHVELSISTYMALFIHRTVLHNTLGVTSSILYSVELRMIRRDVVRTDSINIAIYYDAVYARLSGHTLDQSLPNRSLC